MKLNFIFILSISLFFTSCQNSEKLRKQANQLEKDKKYEEAIQILDKAIVADNENIKAYLDRAVDHSILQQYQKSINDYSKVIELDSDNQLAYLNKAKNLRRIEQYQQAVLDLNKAYNLVKNDKTIQEDGILGLLDESIDGKLKDEDVIYDINIVDVLFERGIVNYNLKNYENTISDFNEFDRYDIDTLAYMLRGLSKIELNQLDQGCEDIYTSYQMGSIEAIEHLKQNCQK